MDRRQRSLLQAIDDVYAERDLERFPMHACAVLRDLIPCDIAAWNDLDPDAGRVVAILVPPEVGWEGMHEALMRNIDQNPLYRRLVDAGDHGPYALSDYLTMAQLRALPLYQEVYRHFGIRYQLAAALEAPPPQVLAFTLNRSTADFEPHERQALAVLRPHLRRAYDVAREVAGLRRDRERLEQEVLAAVRRAELAPRVDDERLTAREAEVLALVAEGMTAKGAAMHLGVSPRTVHKHLQHAYRKLGAPNRLAALHALRE